MLSWFGNPNRFESVRVTCFCTFMGVCGFCRYHGGVLMRREVAEALGLDEDFS